MKNNDNAIRREPGIIFMNEVSGATAASGFPVSLLRKDAFILPDKEKTAIIAHHFGEIMQTLGLDLSDDSLKDTPERVARMYVQEMFSGLKPQNKPRPALFENKFRYNHMLVERNIGFTSCCEHHFVPVIGKAHVAYFPSDKIIGLSKINRIVQYYAKRPQVQERLTVQIAGELQELLGTKDVAVLIEATHLCVTLRGVQDAHSSTVTTWYEGTFRKEEVQAAFLGNIKVG